MVGAGHSTLQRLTNSFPLGIGYVVEMYVEVDILVAVAVVVVVEAVVHEETHHHVIARRYSICKGRAVLIPHHFQRVCRISAAVLPLPKTL